MNFDFSFIDLAFKNGKVITVNPTDDIVEAVGIKGNKIVFVGSNEDLDAILAKQEKEAKVYDLKGRTLMPGMIDSHIHPFLVGMLNPDPESPMISLFGDNAKCLADIKEWIRKALEVKKPGQWISMWGYEVPNLEENRDPTIEELDEWAPDNPVQCMEGSGHKSMFNHKALEVIDVYTAEDAKKYPEGDIEVKDGKLTGMVYGVTCFLLWSKVAYSADDMKKAALIANDQGRFCRQHAGCQQNRPFLLWLMPCDLFICSQQSPALFLSFSVLPLMVFCPQRIVHEASMIIIHIH